MNKRDHQTFLAAERLDVLEEPDELPVGICSVRGCTRGGMYYPQPSAFGRTHWICSWCRGRYREHDRILKTIRSIPDRPVI